MSKEAVSLPVNYEDLSITNDFLKVINTRSSHRIFTSEGLSLLELSYLLWCCQGVKGLCGKRYATLRAVPSGGARHAFECYLANQNVKEAEARPLALSANDAPDCIFKQS